MLLVSSCDGSIIRPGDEPNYVDYLVGSMPMCIVLEILIKCGMSRGSREKPPKSFARKLTRPKSVAADLFHYYQCIYASVVTLFPISSVNVDGDGLKIRVHIRLYNMRLAMPFTIDLSRSLIRVYEGKELEFREMY